MPALPAIWRPWTFAPDSDDLETQYPVGIGILPGRAATFGRVRGPVTFTGAPVFRGSAAGPSAQMPVASARMLAMPARGGVNDPIAREGSSFLWHGVFPSHTAGSQVFIAGRYYVGASYAGAFMLQIGAGGSVTVALIDASGTTQSYASTLTVPTLRPTSVLVKFNAASIDITVVSMGPLEIWRENIATATLATTAGSGLTSLNFHVGAQYSNLANTNARHALAAWSPIYLPESVAIQPWSLFKPRRIVVPGWAAGVGGGGTTIGQPTESDAAQALTPYTALTQAIGQVAERDSAGALTPALSLSTAIGAVTEHDAAQAVTYTPAGSIGQVVERDSAQAMTPTTALAQAIGQVVERDAAQAVTVLQTRTIGLALEIDVAQAVTVVAGGLSVQIGQVVESSLARPFTAGAAGGTASAADVWNYVLSNGKTAEETAVETHAMLTALSSLLAACPANLALVMKLLRNKQITNPTTGKMTVYDDDGSTVLVEGDLFQDAAGTRPYAGAGAERRERLA